MRQKVAIRVARTNWLMVAIVTGWEDAGLLLKLVSMVNQLLERERERGWHLQLPQEAFTVVRA